MCYGYSDILIRLHLQITCWIDTTDGCVISFLKTLACLLEIIAHVDKLVNNFIVYFFVTAFKLVYKHLVLLFAIV